jgi:hypothetical protein
MLSNLIATVALLGSMLLLVIAAGVALFGLARGNGPLVTRALRWAGAYVAVYLLAVLASPLTARRRVLPPGSELSFCGIDCHLHVSVAGSTTEPGQVRAAVRVRSDAVEAPEYPGYLQFRLVGADGSILPPNPAPDAFTHPLAAGESYVDTLAFAVPATGGPYSLRVTYAGVMDNLMLGPANPRAAGKASLALGGQSHE